MLLGIACVLLLTLVVFSASFAKNSVVALLAEGAVPTSELQPSQVTELQTNVQMINFATNREVN